MKNRSVILYLLGLLVSFQAAAQNEPPVNEPDYNRPRLFDRMPDTIQLNLTEVSRAFTQQAGEAVDFNLSADSQMPFRFQGSLLSRTSKYNNALETVVLKSSNFSFASFSLSRVQQPEGGTELKGRIVSLKHGDLYELVKTAAGGYLLVKRNYYDLVNE